MHGCILESAPRVNAEVDSMGEVVDGRVGISSILAPQHPAIEEAQDELRLEYDVREERRRELEFLERGGNPLDYKLGNGASVSVQSTSLTNQPRGCEAKDSFVQTTSPRGDSVESSGRPGACAVCEPNSADNLLLFDGESEFIGGERNPVQPSKNVIAPLLQGSQNAKESGESGALPFPKNQAYRRRIRTRPNRDNAQSRPGHVPSVPSGPKDFKVSIVDANNSKDKSIAPVCNSKPCTPSGNLDCKATPSHSRSVMELDDLGVAKSTVEPPVPEPGASKSFLGEKPSLHSGAVSQGNSGLPESTRGSDQLISVVHCPQSEATVKAETKPCPGNEKRERSKMVNEDGNVTRGPKCLDSESSCTPISLNRNINDEAFINLGNADADRNNENKFDGSCVSANEVRPSGYQSEQGNGSLFRSEKELLDSVCHIENEVKSSVPVNSVLPNGNSASVTERRANDQIRDESIIPKGNASTDLSLSLASTEKASSNKTCGSVDASVLVQTILPSQHYSMALEKQPCSEACVELEIKAHEDAILEEALTIEAKQKRIAELSVITLPTENFQKSHWNFVLEEMAWLANDFSQERLWKLTAAAQLGRQITFASHLRSKENFDHCKQKKVAYSLAKAIMDFWQLAEEKLNHFQPSSPGKKNSLLAVHGYAARFLKYNKCATAVSQEETTVNPDWTYDLLVMKLLPEDRSQGENLFYKVPFGAMEAYRRSIESYIIRCQKIGNVQEEVDTSSMHDAATANIYDEDEGETNTYFLPGGFGSNKSSRFPQKKKKNSIRFYTGRSYDRGSDMPNMENKFRNQQTVQMGKKPAGNLSVGPIPPKRMRTASRPRVLGPINTGSSGGVLGITKTDSSSGDTNSFQDDQSTYRSGYLPNSFEVESTGDFEKQPPFDSTEVSKPRKKKKAKYMMDHSKRRLDGHQFDSNGSSGFPGQHIRKKQKMLKSLDNPMDNHVQTGSSIPSPAASQMSNMHNPNKIIRILNGRDRIKKFKAFKIPAGQSGSGSPWSLFEDQALVVLVHDLGPNWEVVSDAINNTLQFKCIFRRPKECKERHSVLMDRTAVDGADSAEDSGSSQPYPSTLPGIPKGSARQLFQRLQEPVEEDMLKSHFEKIIMISQKLSHRSQNDCIDGKRMQPHPSHILALQLVPNYVDGGPPATPLDLCDTPASSPDGLSLGYQGSLASGLAITHPGSMASVLPTSGANSSIQGSSGVVHANNFSSSSVPGNTSMRDGRYVVPRSAALPIDEQKRMQQYNQVPGRNVQTLGLPVPSAPQGTDRSVRMLPSGNGMGVMCGKNRNMPMTRPGLQGFPSPSILNSGSAPSSNMTSMPHPTNMHHGVGSGQGMLSPRDNMHMMRPGQNPDHQRQIVTPELHMQISQGNNQGGVPSFGGLSPGFSNQTLTSPVQLHPVHQQQQQSHLLNSSHIQGQNHSANTQNQMHAHRLAKERQLQKQRLHQHQQHMTHVPPQHHLPSAPNSPQLQPQASLAPASQPSTTTTITQQQHQNVHTPPHGFGRTQVSKQRQRQQQFQQSSGQHPQQRQQSQSQQQAKLSKGAGREGNLSKDYSLPNGITAAPGNQSSSKGDQVMHSIQGQGLHTVSGVNHVQTSKPPGPQYLNQNRLQTKMHNGQPIPSTKQVQNTPIQSDNNSKGHMRPTSNHTIPVATASINHKQLQQHQKSVNQSQLLSQKVLQHNCPPDPPNKLQENKSQVDDQTVGNPTEVVEVTGSQTSSIDSKAIGSSTSGQGKVSEKEYDSNANSALSSSPVANSSLTNAAGSEIMTTMGKGLPQGQSSSDLSPINVLKQPQIQSPNMRLPMTQLQKSSNQQVTPRQQPQQQTEHLPAENNNLSMRPTNPMKE
ncbi:chromatin modification-related protein EAF1 B-like isoform X2 [Impatiens glandulifera]|uniref:chromatin modification-related protein EAF1 B-like isoform X2 n=1 Tax=Impatiens glandulifera TaxID=253017 RepID=UPI001FB1479C|nr:chromatin modification-related protein EAF1 B-like isoform X2 [Impatiens glandulifera]